MAKLGIEVGVVGSGVLKGRTTDVLGIERGIAGEVAEKEKGLRKIAQRGVIQLFNAFRAAHVKAEEARRQERKAGTVGMGEREKKGVPTRHSSSSAGVGTPISGWARTCTWVKIF